MDSDFIRVLVITCILIGFIVLFVWIKSRTKRRIIKAVAQAQEVLNLTPVASKHPQLDTVWYAVRGQVSGLTVRIFGGKSRRGRNTVATEGIGAMATPIDRAFVMIIVSLPKVIPFSFNIQRRLALSTPRFGTSYEEFDKIVEVKTDDEKKALKLLNYEQLRTAIISFIKLAANVFITKSEVMIKVSTNKQVLPAVQEAVKLAALLGNQIEAIYH